MKFKKLTLHNYRSWAHQEFTFIDGLNVISGDGGGGKSAILKGIYFLTNNDQDGDIHSSWLTNDKGALKRGETTWVEAELDTGDIVRREKGNSINKYVLNGKNIENFGRGVPQEVAEVFNLNEVNIQTQFDSHFLLSDKESAVAKTLNKIVDLEIIDKSIKNINSVMRSIKNKKKNSDANLEKYSKEIEIYSFVEGLEKQIEDIESLIILKEEIITKCSKLSTKKENIQNYKKELLNIGESSKYEKDVGILLNLIEQKKTLSNKNSLLLEYFNRIVGSENSIKTICHVDMQEVNDILSLMNRKDKLDSRYQTLKEKLLSLQEASRIKESLVPMKYSGECGSIIKLIEKKDTLNKKIVLLENKYNDILDSEEDLEKLKKDIKANFSKIKGANCPLCGSVIENLENIC